MELWQHIEPLMDQFGPDEIYRIVQALDDKGLKSRRGGPISYNSVFRTIERMKPVFRDEFIGFEPDWTDEQLAQIEAAGPEPEATHEWVPIDGPLPVGSTVLTANSNEGVIRGVVGDGFGYFVELKDGRVVRKSPEGLSLVRRELRT